jgi:hypothetical protein
MSETAKVSEHDLSNPLVVKFIGNPLISETQKPPAKSGGF